MSLTNTTAQNAKASRKTRRLFDKKGLYLEISPAGKVHIYRRPNRSSWQCAELSGPGRIDARPPKEKVSRRQRGCRRLVLAGTRQAPRRRIEKRQAIPRSCEVVPARIRHHDARTAQSDLCARTARTDKGHLVPFFGSMVLPEITAGKINEYRIQRLEECKAQRGKPPAHNTMHQEIVTLRQIFKTALRQGWIDHLPDLSAPYCASAKISHRAWFSPEGYKQLYEAPRKRAHAPKQPRFRWEAEQLHDYVLFSANTGLRPDEAMRLEFRDVTVVAENPDTTKWWTGKVR